MKDGGGTIDIDEIEMMFTALGIETSRDDIRKMFETVKGSYNRDEEDIDFNEFITLMITYGDVVFNQGERMIALLVMLCSMYFTMHPCNHFFFFLFVLKVSKKSKNSQKTQSTTQNEAENDSDVPEKQDLSALPANLMILGLEIMI